MLRALITLALSATSALADSFPVQRCVNLGNALDAPRFEGEWGYQITENDLDWIADEGFDTVRLPVRFSAHWRDGQIDDWILGRVDQVIWQAQERGLNVILDLHHFEEIHENPESQRAKFKAIWYQLANHYAPYGDDLMFELLNEPADNLTTDLALDLYRAVLPTIRASNPDRWIVVGGGLWSNITTLPDMPDIGPRVITTFHYYDPFDFSHQTASWLDDPPPPRGWGDADDLQDLANNFAIAKAFGRSLFLGEFGAVESIDTEDRTRWTRAVREAAEAQNIGWCVWAMQANFAIRDPETGGWMPGMKDALMAD